MQDQGCAVTSAAMVLNYHGMNHFIDGTLIDPGSLNQWFKSNGGYLEGYNKNGEPYSFLNFMKIGQLSRLLFVNGKAPYKLEVKISKAVDTLDSDLLEGNPQILKVRKTGLTNSHFIVATGKDGDDYRINDPEGWSDSLSFFTSPHLGSYRFIKSNTNLSYIVLVANPQVEILVTDSYGRRTGKIIENSNVYDFNEIPTAIYQYEDPISNPYDGSPKNFGIDVNAFYLPKPENSNYIITLSSNEIESYILNANFMRGDGEDENYIYKRAVSIDRKESITVGYTQTSKVIERTRTTFSYVVEDIQLLYSLG